MECPAQEGWVLEPRRRQSYSSTSGVGRLGSCLGMGVVGASPGDRQWLRISDWVKTQFISTRPHQDFGFIKTASGVSQHCGSGAPSRLGSGEVAVACILAYGATAAVCVVGCIWWLLAQKKVLLDYATWEFLNGSYIHNHGIRLLVTLSCDISHS